MDNHLTCQEPPPVLWRRLARSRGVQALAAIILFGAVLAWWLRKVGGIGGVRDRFGLLSALVIVPLHAVLAISPFPSEIVGFGNGAVFGVRDGAVLNWLGWMSGSLLHYTLMRRAAGELDLERALARAPRWLRRFPAHHPAFLILGRWLPYGPQLTSTVGGALRVPPLRFAWCMAVANVPVATFFAFLGSRVA